MRGACYIRLISWTLRSGNEQLLPVGLLQRADFWVCCKAALCLQYALGASKFRAAKPQFSNAQQSFRKGNGGARCPAEEPIFHQDM